MGIVALGQGRSAGTSNLSDTCFPIPSVGKKGLTYPHRALQQSQPLGKEHEWVENQTFNHLCRGGGEFAKRRERQSWAHGQSWAC